MGSFFYIFTRKGIIHQIRMNKVTALFALALLVQLANSNPVSQADEIEKATPGLKCYHQQREDVLKELDCSFNEPTGKDLSAKYCATITGPNRTVKSCAHKTISDAFQNIGLTSPGCEIKDDKTFCLCSGNLCNA